MLHHALDLFTWLTIFVAFIVAIRRGETYRALWQAAERDRKEADRASIEMASTLLHIADTLALNAPDPELRGEARKFSRMIRERAQKELQVAARGGDR